MPQQPSNNSNARCDHLREVMDKRRANGQSSRIRCLTPYLAPSPPLNDCPSSSATVRVLTHSELASMRREFAASAAWMDEMIRSGKIDEL